MRCTWCNKYLKKEKQTLCSNCGRALTSNNLKAIIDIYLKVKMRKNLKNGR